MLNDFDDLDILGVIFDSNMIFEKHHCSIFRAASQMLDILRKSWRELHDKLLLGRCFVVLASPLRSTFLHCHARCTHSP